MIDASNLNKSIYDLIVAAGTGLPSDVLSSLSHAASRETPGTPAHYTLNLIQHNIALAQNRQRPLCQDTGNILFFIKCNSCSSQTLIRRSAEEAVARATEAGVLRQNSVDPITGRNSGNNLGPGTPCFYFEEWEDDDIDIRIILKGGGCENMGRQYSLPDDSLNAERDLDGVRKVILHAVQRAQGLACAPGVVSVVLGGDRSSAYLESKKLFLRRLDDTNLHPVLARLEEQILEEANSLEIGPMGLGGRNTLLGLKIGYQNRIPASYFVTVSYMCWSFRRHGYLLSPSGDIKKIIYESTT